ncbi:ABC transporter substrate-binding protein [Paracraurococcus ruber]|uniref:Peptide ABC transporter substrate-binding protein n=1 Tax=Paracraurococcus ruber TaxID=77675 RepID=A0ABS1CS53_9PROT|nr:ABC transporter substrate-binding protein [Paracraurococcus ruber]MBK1657021.1 peptide ABC transporter substrate-binding protein [Paracraurococcus ruber]TDG34283.1 peptide ABC transporter substrate-binding protein [Paracraurococcus ruber]
MRATRRSLIAGLPFLTLADARAQRAPGQFRFGLSAFPPSVQAWANTGTAAATVKLLIHRGLLSYDTAGKLRGELAEAWSNEGAATWVFRLRPNAVFQNGDPVTAADIRWNLEQMAAERSTAFYRNEMQGIERIETPDERTVRITMKTPVATLPYWMASYHMGMVSRRSTPQQQIGAGPFILRGQERGTFMDLAAFDRYYKPGLPRLKDIRIIAYADETLRVAALQAGDVDLIEYVPWQSMAGIEADSRLTLDAVFGPFMYLVFNATRGPLADARVRRAIAHAIRRDDIVKAAFFGRGAPLEGLPIAPQSEFFDAELARGWHFDPALARRLLAEAGVAGGFTTSILATAQYGMHKDTAEVVQQSLAAIGIQAELRLPDWATRVNLGNRGQYEIAVQGTATDNNDPDGISNLVDGSLSPSYVRSLGLRVPALEEAMAAARAEFDPARRKVLYRDAQRIALQEVPICGLAWRSQGYAMPKTVTGFRNMPGALSFFSGITLEETAIAG